MFPARGEAAMKRLGRSRGLRVVVGVTVVAAAVLAVAALSRSGRSENGTASTTTTSVVVDSPDEAAAAARRACAAMAAFEQAARRNDPASVALEHLHLARELSNAASAYDSAWVRLAGGVRAVEMGFDEDSARATGVGIGVVRSECAQFDQRN